MINLSISVDTTNELTEVLRMLAPCTTPVLTWRALSRMEKEDGSPHDQKLGGADIQREKQKEPTPTDSKAYDFTEGDF